QREQPTKTRLWLGEEWSGDGGASLNKFLLELRERIGEVGFDVEFADELLVHEDGHNDFGLHHVGAREVTRILGAALHPGGLAGGSSGSAQAGRKRDAGIRREAARVRPDDEVAGVGWVHQIKARPVVASHFGVELVRDHVHERRRRRLLYGVRLEFLEQLAL